MAIAMAVLYYLTSYTRAISLFATHYASLAADFSQHPGIKFLNMDSFLDDEKREVSNFQWLQFTKSSFFLQLIFLYKLVEGSASSSFGTHVASLAGVNAKVVKRAQEVSNDFSAKFLAMQTARIARILPLICQADFAFLCRFVQQQCECKAENVKRLRATREVLKQILGKTI